MESDLTQTPLTVMTITELLETDEILTERLKLATADLAEMPTIKIPEAFYEEMD